MTTATDLRDWVVIQKVTRTQNELQEDVATWANIPGGAQRRR